MEKTVGQYNIYRLFFREIEPERILFLAIAQDIYQDLFQRKTIQKIVENQKIKLLVFDPAKSVKISNGEDCVLLCLDYFCIFLF